MLCTVYISLCGCVYVCVCVWTAGLLKKILGVMEGDECAENFFFFFLIGKDKKNKLDNFFKICDKSREIVDLSLSHIVSDKSSALSSRTHLQRYSGIQNRILPFVSNNIDNLPHFPLLQLRLCSHQCTFLSFASSRLCTWVVFLVIKTSSI